MSAETPSVSELHLIVGFDGSPPAVRALETSVRMLSVRPPGRITVAWVAHLSGALSSRPADATAIMESDFDQVAGEVRAAAAEQLDGSGLAGTFSGVQVPDRAVADRGGRVGDHTARPDDVVVILVGSSHSAMHRVVGSVAVTLAHHLAGVPITVVP